MPDLFESEIDTVQVLCTGCGTPLEIASTALGVFGSQDAVLCMECLLRQGSGAAETSVTLTERVGLIDDTVEMFSAHLRNVLMRCVKPDLTWNREYGVGDWSDPMDTIAAAYGPGIWYAVRREQQRPRSRDDE